MINPNAFFNYVTERELDLFVGVPDSLLSNICACITDRCAPMSNIITANEGNAVAIATGYHVATGKYGVVYMQNSGLGNTVNPILSIADEAVYSVPMLMLIGWRGEPGVKDEPQHVTQGELTLPLLDIMRIKYEILDDNYEEQVNRAIAYMVEHDRPYALVIKKGVFENYTALKPLPIAEYELTREDALEIVIDALRADDFVVSTTGKTSREIFEIRERRGEGHANDFLTVGGMGHTASIAFGMALGSSANVYCIDGDGSFLMHMGSLGVIAQNIRPNFHYIIINNGVHESVGGQPTVGFDIDVAGILISFGFDVVDEVDNAEDLRVAVNDLRSPGSRALIINTRAGSRDDLGRPTVTPIENKRAMMERFASLSE